MNILLAHPFPCEMVSCPPFQGKGGLRVESHFKNEVNSRSIEIGGGPNLLIFFGAKKLVKCRKKKSGLRPENKGGPKIEKKNVVFWHKKCEKFQTRHPIFFFSKKFQPTNAAEKALCTKRHFSNGNHSKKKPQKIPKFPNFC